MGRPADELIADPEGETVGEGYPIECILKPLDGNAAAFVIY